MTSVVRRSPLGRPDRPLHDPGRHASPPILATLVLGAQVVTSELDFSTVGLTTEGGADLERWALLALLWFVPFGVLLVTSVALPRLARRPPQRPMTWWLGWSLLTVLWSVDPRQTVLQGLGVVALWATSAWYVHQWGFRAFARTFVAAATLFLLAGLVRDGWSGLAEGGLGRAEGLAFNPTNLARVAVILLLVAAWLLAQPGGRRSPWVVAALPTGVLVLLVSDSRMAVLSLVVAVLYLVARQQGVARALGLGVALTVAVVAFVAWVGSPTEAVGRRENPDDLGSLNGRTTIWDVGADLAGEGFLVGYGTASGEVLWLEAAQDGRISWLATNAHNVLLEVQLSQGVVGVVLFGAGVASYVRRSWGQQPGLDVLLLALLVGGLTESLVNRPSTTVVVLGALFAVAAARPDRRRTRGAGLEVAAP